MEQELHPLMAELCYLAVKRNEINTRRHRARFRKNYYAKAVRVVEAHNDSNSQLRKLRYDLKLMKDGRYYSPEQMSRLTDRITTIELSMAKIRAQHPKPKKWQDMGLHKLRSLVLQGQGEYAIAKHETMEFSIKHRTRVKYLTTALNCGLAYDNGSVNAIIFKKDNHQEFIDLEEITEYAKEFELNKAVEGMLK